jgi:hypothetical protein
MLRSNADFCAIFKAVFFGIDTLAANIQKSEQTDVVNSLPIKSDRESFTAFNLSLI